MGMHKLFTCRMTWRAFYVTLVDDSDSQAGKQEILDEIQINETMPTYTTSLLNVPPLAFDYGLVKLVFRLDV